MQNPSNTHAVTNAPAVDSKSAAMYYKRQLICRLEELQKTVDEAPADFDMQRRSVSKILAAAGELINSNASTDPNGNLKQSSAEQRMISDLNEAIAPFGLSIEFVAYPGLGQRLHEAMVNPKRIIEEMEVLRQRSAQ